MSTLIPLIGFSVMTLGCLAVIFGGYGIIRTIQVKPRARRPDLAPLLYAQFTLVIFFGVLLMLTGGTLLE